MQHSIQVHRIGKISEGTLADPQAAEAARERDMDAAEAARLLIEQRRMRERFDAEQSADASRHSAAELRASGGRLASQARTAWVVSDSLPAPCSSSDPSELARTTSLDAQQREAD